MIRKGTQSPKSPIRRRMALVALGFLFGFAALTYRCLYLHLSHDPKLEKIARSQYQTIISEAPPRGRILDVKGEELAVSIPTASLAVRPSKITDHLAVETLLRGALGLSGREIQEKLDSSKPYVWIKRHLTPNEESALRSTKLAGLEIVKESRRFYPNRELASQLLGAVGWEGEGLSGVELLYDRFLRTNQTGEVAYRDARGQTLQMAIRDPAEEEPNDVTLTVSQAIQYVTESELASVCEEKKAKGCTAVVMDPRTGAVLAIASYPGFNPNSYGFYDLARWRNRAVTDSFEPGSIFKVIVAASALEAGAARPEDRFFCENGSYRIGDHTIHDHSPYGLLTFEEILKVSSNIGAYKIGHKTGRRAFEKIIHDFGFGQKTAIDFPGEEPGAARSLARAQEIEFANMTFGQGIRVTPIQIASAFATIANGGVRMKPYLVSRITDSEGRAVWSNSPKVIGRVLSEQTAKTLTTMMMTVTEEGGTGVKASIPGYTVAGKTGTSQKVENGRYSHSKFVGSFVGFAPAEDPRVVVLVTVDEPKGAYYGGVVAAPVFRRVAWAALRELGIPPSTPQKSSLPVVREASLFPVSTSPVSETSEKMPDLRGFSKREALSFLDRLGAAAETKGSGVVISQEPSPGALMGEGKRCRIVLSTEP